MKSKIALWLAGLAVVLTGCIVTSVCPFYAEKDVVFEPALLGTWQMDEATWKFTQEGEKAYRVSYTEDGKTSVMDGHAFKLRGVLFLDLCGQPTEEEVLPAIPAHLLLRVETTQPVLKLAPLNLEWLNGLLEQDSKALRHHRIRGEQPDHASRLVLTANTGELQAFITKHLDTKEAWKDGLDLKRPDKR
jgi:hypothetical protein